MKTIATFYMWGSHGFYELVRTPDGRFLVGFEASREPSDYVVEVFPRLLEAWKRFKELRDDIRCMKERRIV